MRAKTKKWFSPLFVLTLAVAGIFGVSAAVVNKQAGETPVVDKADAATTNANNIYLHFLDKTDNYNEFTQTWGGGDPQVHMWSITISSDSSFASVQAAVEQAGGTWNSSDSSADFVMSWAGESGGRNWQIDFPWYITGFSYKYKSTNNGYWTNNQKDNVTSPYCGDDDNVWGGVSSNTSSYFGSKTSGHTKSTTTYTLSFNSKSGSAVASQTLKEYQKTVKPDDPTRSGYVFSKWTETDSASAAEYTFGSNITADKILYAQWINNTYTITYNVNGGSGSNPESQTVTVGNSVTLRSYSGTKTGYTFSGYWNTNSGGTGSSYSAGASATPGTSAGGTLALFAKWTAKTSALTFDLEGATSGTAPTGKTATYNQNMPAYGNSAPTKTGYTFGGFYDGDNGTGTQYYTSALASARKWDKDTTSGTILYAKWTVNSHTLTWNFNGGTPTGSYTAAGSVAYNTTLQYPTTMTKTGWTFTSWSSTPATMPDSNLTITANYTAKTTTVTLDRQSGTGGTASVTATYDSAMPAISLPSRDGFTFGGYYTETGGSGTQYYTNTGASARNWNIVDSTKTLYAKWTANSYTITFHQNDGSGYTVEKTKTGGTAYTIPAPADIEMGASAGRRFLSWNTRSDGSGITYAVGASYTTNEALDLYMIQDWYTYQYRINDTGEWHDLSYKDPADSKYVREYYPSSDISLITGDTISFRRYYGAGDPESIGGTVTFDGNYDGSNGVKYGVTGLFYLKAIKASDNYDCWVAGGTSTRAIVITRGTTDLYFPLAESGGEWISTFITIQEGDIIKGKYESQTAYPVTYNTYSQGNWSNVASGVQCNATGIFKVYLQASSGSNFDIVYFQMDSEASAIFFAQSFNSQIGGVCTGIMGGTKSLSDLTTAWGLNDTVGLYHSYSLLSDDAKDYLIDTSENADIIAFFAKYDYVLKKYGTSTVGDFMGRKSKIGASAVNNFKPFELITGNDGDNATTILIIIASSISILSITALSVLMVKKKKSANK